MRTRVLDRMATDTVSVEPYTSRDGQGAPSYGASQDISARVVETDEVIRDADGVDVRVTLMLIVAGDESPLPDDQDRITVSGSTYIVVTTEQGKQLDGTVNHLRVMAKDE